MNYSDEELLNAIAGKDENAFNLLYKRYCQTLFNWVLYRTGNRIISEEISQIFWVSVWNNPLKIRVDTKKSAKGFLFNLLNFCMLDYLKSPEFKKYSSCGEYQDEIEDDYSYLHIEEELNAKDIYGLINEVLEDIPELTKKIYILRRQQNYSVEETADYLSVKKSTVRVLLSSAVSTIKSKLIQMKYVEQKQS